MEEMEQRDQKPEETKNITSRTLQAVKKGEKFKVIALPRGFFT